MQIQRIHLQNFQSIKGPVRLDLAPITLLYGPNSAGKSAVGDAVRLIGKLSTREVTPEVLIHAVHMRNPETRMAIGIGGRLSDPETIRREILNVDFLQPGRYFNLLGLSQYEQLDFHEEFKPKGTFAYRVIGEIIQDGGAYREGDSAPPIPEFDVVFEFSGTTLGNGSKDYWLDGLTFAVAGEWLAKVSHKGFKISVNRLHSKLARTGSLHRLFDDFFKEAKRLAKVIRTRRGRALVEVTRESVTIHGLFLPFEGCFVRESFIYEGFESLGLDIAFYAGAIKTLSSDEAEMEEIYRDLEEDVWRHSNTKLAVLNEWLIGLIRIPAEMAVASARRMLALGPLRDIPSGSDLALVRDSTGRAALNVNDGADGWAAGRAAWLAAPSLDLKVVNAWLAASDRLDMPYEIRKSERRIETSADTRSPLPPGYPEDGARYFSVFLWDRILGQPVVPADVGTGVSQVIPVLLAAISPYGNRFLEQPELHLHPRLQGAVMDYLIAASRNGSITIIETHSEHLALRALRRVRETGRADIKHRDFSLTPDNLALYYFEPKDGVTTVHGIRVDHQGRFLDQWPEGFFDERAEDLFDALR